MKKCLLVVALAAFSLSIGAQTQQVKMYNRLNGGYVIVNAEGDILGFSDKGSAKNLSAEMSDIFQDMGMSVQATSEPLPASVEAFLSEDVTDSIAPLLGDIEFAQSAPYNNLAPTGQGGQRCMAGCVAIAMAQIMAYYQYPEEGCKGTIEYKTSTLSKTIKVNMEGETFDWENILPTYKNGYDATQAAAVAKLVYYCGASAYMDYGVGASGTNSSKVPNAFYANFDYDENVQHLTKGESGYTDAQWNELIQSELKGAFPVYMSSQQKSGSGHAYVCDGYKILKGFEKYPYYHINWGWDGSCNGWFMLNSLKITSENPEDFTDLSYNLAIIYNIRPKGYTPVEDVHVETTSTDAIYDILGNRVTEMRAGNIYIVNGKKVIVKQ